MSAELKKVGIIGGGNVGGTLARRLLSKGADVLVGVPETGDSKYEGLPVVAPLHAAVHGDVVILALPWGAAESALKAVMPALTGKTLVDAMNPIAADFSGLTHGHQDSGAQQVARWVPEANVVKAFNTVGFNIMADPILKGIPTTLLIAGDSAEAKTDVMNLARAIDFAPLDVGGLDRAPLLEASAWLWITLSRTLGREYVFNYHTRN